MNGVLVHSTKGWLFETIMNDGRLKPSSVTDSKGNDYKGPNIFFELVPEDLSLKTRKSHFTGGLVQFIMKPNFIEAYGKKDYKITSYDKELEKYGPMLYPDHKVWFSTDWLYGMFLNDEEDKSVNYDPTKSLQENIKLFHDALKTFKGKHYKKYFDINMRNEVVVQSKSIPLKNNVLVIFYRTTDDEKIKKLQEQYPDYIFTNKQSTLDKIVRDYYDSLDL